MSGSRHHIEATHLQEEPRAAHGEAAETLRLLELVLDEAPIGFGFVDTDFRVVRLNETLAAINGSSAEEQVGQTVAAITPDLWSRLEPFYRQVLDSGQAVLDVEVERAGTTTPGRSRMWLTSYYPVSVEGTSRGIGIITVDVTERHAAEKAGRLLSAIVQGSADAIVGLDLGGAVVSWNRAAEGLFGYTEAEMIGLPISLVFPPDNPSAPEEMLKRVAAARLPERWETQCRRKDASTVEVLVTVSTTTAASGDIDGLSLMATDITETRRSQVALLSSQRRLAVAQRIARMGSFEANLADGTFAWSEELPKVLGLDPEAEANLEALTAGAPLEDRQVFERLWSAGATDGTPFGLVYRIERSSTKAHCLHVRAMPERGEDGQVVKILGTVTDDTEALEAERLQRLTQIRFETGFDQAMIGALIADLSGVPIRVNRALCSFLGRPEADLVGTNWTGYGHPDETPFAQAVVAQMAAGHDTYADERRFLLPQGGVVWASTNVTLVRDESGEALYYFVQLQDITQPKALSEELTRQALHDSLTGLPNRALLTDRMTHSLARARRHNQRLAVMFIGIDQFKMVNDSLGHTSGDEVLVGVASQISAVVRDGDTVARFGGDQFVVVCDDLSAVRADAIAQRILAAVGQTRRVGAHDLNLTASLGLAFATPESSSESLLRDADAAMNRAKQRGRGSIELFDAALRAGIEERLDTASGLHRALERGEFEIHYQPIVDLSSGAMVAAEALLRWKRPGHGLIPPAVFIPLAEETGLIVPLGAWVLERACEELVRWQVHIASLRVAVNLSVQQLLAPSLKGMVGDVLARTALQPGDLCLELTESVFLEEFDYFTKMLSELKSVGVGLALDDFGTGYSSLGRLKRFPFDEVKIDRSFIEGLGRDPSDSAVVAAILGMADALGLTATAEGVETEDQLSRLKALGCSRAQGFYLAKPLPAAEMMALVELHGWTGDG